MDLMVTISKNKTEPAKDIRYINIDGDMYEQIRSDWEFQIMVGHLETVTFEILKR